MTAITASGDFQSSRLAWFEDVANLINESSPMSISGPWGEAIPAALIRIHIFAGHFSGFRDADLTMGDIDIAAVTREVHRWRVGNVPARVARYWEAAWHSLYLIARDAHLIDPELLAELLRTPTGQHMARATRRDLDPLSASPDILPRADRLATEHWPETPDPESLGPLHFGSPHLVIANLMIRRDPNEAFELLTPLEFLCALPESGQDRTLDRWLTSGASHQRFYLSTRGEWSGSAKHRIADHMADWILRMNGRQGHSTTGVVPGWFATTESEADLRGFRRTSYAGGLASTQTNDCFRIHLRPLDESGAPLPLCATFCYPRDIEALQDLATLAAMGGVLFDLLHIDGSDELRHEACFNIPIPNEIIDEAIAWIGCGFEGWSVERYLETLPSREGSAGLRAEAAERRRFEIAHLARARVDGRLDGDLASALHHFLHALRGASVLGDIGTVSPETAEYDSARSELRSLINDLRPFEQRDESSAIASLGTNRAFLHFESQSGLPVIVASWLGEDGRLQRDWFEFSSFRWLDASSIEARATLLADGLSDIKSIQSKGVYDVVLSSPTWGYTEPLHQAFLNVGFLTASYGATLELLRPPLAERERRQSSRPDGILAWSGLGINHLRGVEAEVQMIRELLPCARLEAPVGVGDPFRFLHVAGHGHSGPTLALTGIDVAPGVTLRGVDVLAEYDLSGTDLVVLCACSTGSARYSPTQLHENAPLDVCFLATGARAVASTAWPVNDLAAFLFSAANYSTLASGGTLWQAFSAGVAAARDRSRESLTPATREIADRHWPGWESVPVGEGSSDDWLAFRLSGRHWE